MLSNVVRICKGLLVGGARNTLTVLYGFGGFWNHFRRRYRRSSGPVLRVPNDSPREVNSTADYMESPPDNDICSICHDGFTVPVQANCSHWYCGTLNIFRSDSSLPCRPARSHLLSPSLFFQGNAFSWLGSIARSWLPAGAPFVAAPSPSWL